MSHHVCILGVYGKGNIGDEALLASITSTLREIDPSLRIVVLCSDPEEASKSAPIDTALRRTPFPDFTRKARLVGGARACILGGGTLLCDHGGVVANVRALASTFFWPIIARLWGTPTVAYAQGVGPATEWPIRFALRHFFPRLEGISLRDAKSKQILESIAGPSTRFILGTDPVISAMEVAKESVEGAVSAEVQNRIVDFQPYCAVSFRTPAVRPYNPREYYASCGRALARFWAATGRRILLFPAMLSERYPDDRIGLEIIEQTLLNEGVPARDARNGTWKTIEEGFALLHGAQLVAGDRLHPLLIGMSGGAPAVGIDIEDKIPRCLAMVDHDLCPVFTPADVGTDQFIEALIAGDQASEKVRQEIRCAVARWGERNSCNMEVLQSVLQHGIHPSH